MSGRLSLAVENGHVVLPDGDVLVIGATGESDLGPFAKDRTRLMWRYESDRAMLAKRGWTLVDVVEAASDAVVIFAPRARDAQKAYLRMARAATTGPIIIDGAKTDGIDALYKAVRKKADVSEAYSKAHGKVFTAMGGDFSDWPDIHPSKAEDGWWRAPGVFSADGIDKASALLAAALPKSLKGTVIDLGAGWGYLSRAVLDRDAVTSLSLVENDRTALEAARKNITDDRARFHCADALTWRPDIAADHVVMNPPFHTGRAATPDLGQAFIRSAASMLKAKGTLWLVANRHLPYERTLEEAFLRQETVELTAGFKVIRAERPRSPFKG